MIKHLLLLLPLLGLGSVTPFAAGAEGKPDSTPRWQYRHTDLKIPGARADEPIRDEFSPSLALSYVEDGVKAWIGQRGCVSCHTPGTYMITRPALTSSFGKPSDEIRDFFLEELVTLRKSPRAEFQRGTASAQVVYITAGLAEWDAHVRGKLSPETDQALRFMFELQQTNGAWHSLDCWPPFESSPYQEATVAVMAAATAPGWWKKHATQADTLGRQIQSAVEYLRTTKPPHDYGRILLLWTSARVDELLPQERKQQLIQLIRTRQNEDGGWAMRDFAAPAEWGGGNRADKLKSEAEFTSPPSDGHMTGLCALVLAELGTKNSDPALTKALHWLSDNQRESGRWWTRSLNTDKFHFITYSGTCYPLLALAKSGRLPLPSETSTRSSR